MGNLLGSPVTDKETFRDRTPEGIEYGVSSMQGWRIHMEDAHICLSELHAVESVVNDNGNGKDETKKDSDDMDSASAGSITPTPAVEKKETPNIKQIDIDSTSIYAVFDGHGGKFSAEYSAHNFVKVLSRNSKMVQYAKEMSGGGSEDAEEQKRVIGLLEQALQESFMDLDMELLRVAVDGTSNNDDTSDNNNDDDRTGQSSEEETMDESGTTIVVVVLTPKWIVCANAGDSRAVYKTADNACALSYDHKPDDDKEESRIRKAGGYVTGGRVDGDLAVSRGLGDFRFKTSPHLGLERQKVSPLPDVIVKSRNDEKDEFIILACDGVWDVLTNQDCVKSVTEIFDEGETDVGLVCEELIDTCLRLGSKDNMTAMIVKLPALKTGKGGGVEARRQRLKEPKDGENYQSNSHNFGTESDQSEECEF